jgi:hypothetical protein
MRDVAFFMLGFVVGGMTAILLTALLETRRPR